MEQLTAEKKRLKMIQLRKDVEEMMQKKRQERAEQMQEMMRVYDEEQREMREKYAITKECFINVLICLFFRQRIIEEERIKMLQEHAHRLIGYLPRGLLRAEDLPYLQSEVMENYKHLLERRC